MAQGFHAEGLRLAIRKYGPDSEQALTAGRDYAMALYQRGETEKSLAELSAAIDRRRAGGGDADDTFLRDAEIRRQQMRFAAESFEEMVRECRVLSEEYDRVLGADHPDAISAHEAHAAALAKLDRMGEAEAEMADVVARRTATGGSEDSETLDARTSHAECLGALGRYGEAEAAWGELAEVKGRLLGAAHADTLAAREKHANVLYKLGRRQEAAAEYGEVAALSATALGSDHPNTRRASVWQADILREIGGPSGPATV